MIEVADTDSSPRFSSIQRVLHWLIAVLVLANLASGMLLVQLGFERVTELLGVPGRDLLYLLHKSFGLTVLALMLIRLFVRLDRGRPAYDPPIPTWQRLASRLVHFLFYVLLIAMPILGWLATDTLNYPVEFFGWNLPQFIAKDKAIGEMLYDWHGIAGWLILAVVVLHVGAGLMHWLTPSDGVFRRMSLRDFRSGPS